VRGTSLPSPSLGFLLAKRARPGGGGEPGPFGESGFREEEDGYKDGIGLEYCWMPLERGGGSSWTRAAGAPSTARARQSDFGLYEFFIFFFLKNCHQFCKPRDI
jgi:hypothetical protein